MTITLNEQGQEKNTFKLNNLTITGIVEIDKDKLAISYNDKEKSLESDSYNKSASEL